MYGFGEVVDVLVVDLAVDLLVRVNLFLAVGNDVGYDDLSVDDESYVAGENLVAVRNEPGTVDNHVVLLENGLESVHLVDYVAFFGVHSVEDGFV